MKKIFLILALLLNGLIHCYAQFSYSAKIGWSWPNIHKGDAISTKSNITIGASIDYTINEYIGLQSGVNYKQVSWIPFILGSGKSENNFEEKSHFMEIPMLFTFSIVPAPKRWRTIWNTGVYANIPIGGYKGKQAYYGLMAALQLEMLSHYFIRGEYQWALSSDNKKEWDEDRRTNMLSVCLGYRF